jgi:hypothetical protein
MENDTPLVTGNINSTQATAVPSGPSLLQQSGNNGF